MCVADGLPTWVCEIMVVKPTVSAGTLCFYVKYVFPVTDQGGCPGVFTYLINNLLQGKNCLCLPSPAGRDCFAVAGLRQSL